MRRYSGLPVPLWGTIGLLFVLPGASLLFLDPTTAQFRSFASTSPASR